MGRAAAAENPHPKAGVTKYHFSKLGAQRGAIMSDVTIVKEGWVQKRGKCSAKLRTIWLVSVLTLSCVLEVSISFSNVGNKVNWHTVSTKIETIFNMC